MTPSDRILRTLLGTQGVLYFGTNLWALIGTTSFLFRNNPTGDVFDTRHYAALALVLSLFFLAGVWRKDLLRPASFLGLGSSVAIILVELFQLPSIGWSFLWIDLLAQAGLAGMYIMVFFFRRDDTRAEETPEEKKSEATTAEPVTDTTVEKVDTSPSLPATDTNPPVSDPTFLEADDVPMSPESHE